MSEKTHIVTMSGGANVAGHTLGIEEAVLSIGVNAIPKISLTCLPTKSSLSYLEPDVLNPAIKDYAGIYGDLADKAESMSDTGDVSIAIEDSAESRKDGISLKGWVLTGVGLSGIGASSAPFLVVELQHPICHLTKAGSIYETPKSDMSIELNKATEGASTFLDVVESAYECVRDKVEYWPAPDGSPAAEFRGMLGVGDQDPKKYLEGGSAGIFLGKAAEGGSGRIAQAIGRMVIPSDGGSSTWDMILGCAGSLLLSVTQDQANNYTTDKLVLEPTQPWKKVSVSINEERCFSTEIPGMDPFRISGVSCRKLGPYSDIVSLGLLGNGNENKKDPVSEVMYSPYKDPSVSDGRIMKTSAPSVLDSAFRRDAPHGLNLSLGLVNMEAARADLYNAALKAYCKALYETTAACMKHATADLALGFHDSGGNLILPGNTCAFMSAGEALYYGYIMNVVHYMSTSGGCRTAVNMSYVRSTPGLGSLIAAGAPNAAYE